MASFILDFFLLLEKLLSILLDPANSLVDVNKLLEFKESDIEVWNSFVRNCLDLIANNRFSAIISFSDFDNDTWSKTN